MSEAPIDTWVLLYRAKQVSMGYYFRQYGEWLSEAGWPVVNPIAWRPLPDPPKE